MSNQFLSLPAALGVFGIDGSVATSPGGEIWKSDYVGDGSNDPTRNKPRTFPYRELLPYPTEDDDRRIHDLKNIQKRLYIAVRAQDFAPGALHWTRELRSWLELKFDLPISARKTFVHLYYELALARGLDNSISERFATMFAVLLKYGTSSLSLDFGLQHRVLNSRILKLSRLKEKTLPPSRKRFNS